MKLIFLKNILKDIIKRKLFKYIFRNLFIFFKIILMDISQ